MDGRLTDPLLHLLATKLEEEINKRGSVLIAGSALALGEGFGVDVTATAMSYQKSVAYIEALQSVIELCVEIDHDRYGKRTKDGDE